MINLAKVHESNMEERVGYIIDKNYGYSTAINKAIYKIWRGDRRLRQQRGSYFVLTGGSVEDEHGNNYFYDEVYKIVETRHEIWPDHWVVYRVL